MQARIDETGALRIETATRPVATIDLNSLYDGEELDLRALSSAIRADVLSVANGGKDRWGWQTDLKEACDVASEAIYGQSGLIPA